MANIAPALSAVVKIDSGLIIKMRAVFIHAIYAVAVTVLELIKTIIIVMMRKRRAVK